MCGIGPIHLRIHGVSPSQGTWEFRAGGSEFCSHYCQDVLIRLKLECFVLFFKQMGGRKRKLTDD